MRENIRDKKTVEGRIKEVVMLTFKNIFLIRAQLTQP
jgi:hypothetical protein